MCNISAKKELVGTWLAFVNVTVNADFRNLLGFKCTTMTRWGVKKVLFNRFFVLFVCVNVLVALDEFNLSRFLEAMREMA